MTLRIATRGSDLARWQADHVASRIRRVAPSVVVSIETFTTRGDRETGSGLREIGGTGLFTAEVDRALLDGRADLAVHSLKDLPIETPKDLAVAAITHRGPVEDVLISRGDRRLAELPEGGVVGTSSPRRASYVRSIRPDLEIVNLRGNVPTRIAQVTSGKLAATVLARAGLVRLGLESAASDVLTDLLPAPGQGALAIVTRADQGEATEIAAALDDPETRRAVEAERAVLAGLGGGCSLPLGVFAERLGPRWRVSSVLYREDGRSAVRDAREGDDPLRLAAESSRALGAKGART